MLVIDYGHPAAELYGPTRAAGTLLAYSGHRVHDDWALAVGRQDLTAHVDFSALDRAARAAGLTPLGLTSQAEFLVGAGMDELLEAIRSDPTTTMEDWLAVRSAVARLLDPRAMGGFGSACSGAAWPSARRWSGWASGCTPRATRLRHSPYCPGVRMRRSLARVGVVTRILLRALGVSCHPGIPNLPDAASQRVRRHPGPRPTRASAGRMLRAGPAVPRTVRAARTPLATMEPPPYRESIRGASAVRFG